jgi:branched-subunit amino acid transport protein
MALTHTRKKRWSLVILLVGLPVYVVVAVSILSALDRPPLWVEFAVYLVLGILWALPFKAVFQGVGREDPDKES